MFGIPLAELSGGIFSLKAFSPRSRPRAHRQRGYIELSMFDGMLNLIGYIGPCG